MGGWCAAMCTGRRVAGGRFMDRARFLRLSADGRAGTNRLVGKGAGKPGEERLSKTFPKLPERLSTGAANGKAKPIHARTGFGALSTAPENKWEYRQETKECSPAEQLFPTWGKQSTALPSIRPEPKRVRRTLWRGRYSALGAPLATWYKLPRHETLASFLPFRLCPRPRPVRRGRRRSPRPFHGR